MGFLYLIYNNPMKSLILKIILAAGIFSILVFYNYSLAQKSLRDAKPSVFTITLKNYQTESKLDTPTSFSWQVVAPQDFQTTYTTLYYGYSSSPSALTKLDSPDAVGYEYKTPDFIKGSYFLPFTFNVSITFPKTGRVWYRAYANIRGDHLWTEEKYLDIIK